MFRFSVLYVFYMIALFIVFDYQEVVNLQNIYTDFMNSAVTFFVNTIGIPAIHSGVDIILPTSVLQVLFGCNGLEAILIFSAAVMAYNSDLLHKLEWLFKGIILLAAINILRVVILAYVIEFHKTYFNLMHDYVTQNMMIFLAIMIFFMFVSKSTQELAK